MLCFSTQKLCLKVRLARNVVFYNGNGCAFVRKVGGVRRRLRMCSPMVAYARLCSPWLGSVLHWGVQVQVVKRIGTVASRWCWVADGGAVLLGNGMAGFHGGAVLLGNGIGGFHGGAVFLGNGMAGFHGGAVLLGNGIGGFYGGAVLLGNGMAGFHGGPVLLGNGIGGFHGGAVLLGNGMPW